MDDLVEAVASGKTKLASGSDLLEPLRSQSFMVRSNDPDAIQRCSRLRGERVSGGMNGKHVQQRTCGLCSGHSLHVDRRRWALRMEVSVDSKLLWSHRKKQRQLLRKSVSGADRASRNYTGLSGYNCRGGCHSPSLRVFEHIDEMNLAITHLCVNFAIATKETHRSGFK